MKKFPVILLPLCLLACNTAEKSTPAAEQASAPAAPVISNLYGYTPSYSTSFVMGDAKNAEAILAVYKEWDNGNLDPVKPLFADSVSMFTSDGSATMGAKDAAFKQIQDFRNNFSAIKSTVHAVFPVKSADKNEDWVLIWATEVNTDKKGKTDSVRLQETWRFNKEGKIDLMYQYAQVAKPAP